jgi:hypothetical protein
MRQLRVYAFRRRIPEPRGYIGYEIIHVQQLQERHWWGWKILDEEIVPTAVKIALGATGYDCSNWTSKFYAVGEFGRDGRITRHG